MEDDLIDGFRQPSLARFRTLLISTQFTSANLVFSLPTVRKPSEKGVQKDALDVRPGKGVPFASTRITRGSARGRFMARLAASARWAGLFRVLCPEFHDSIRVPHVPVPRGWATEFDCPVITADIAGATNTFRTIRQVIIENRN